MIRNQLFIGAALLVGAAIGYVLKPETPSAGVATDHVRVPASKIDDRGVDASVAALRSRVAELEAQLAEMAARPSQKAASAGEANAVDAAAQQRAHHGPPSAKNMRERMEKLKQEDPKRYAEITRRMAQFRQRRVERANRKLDFLASVDTSTMTDEQKKAHERYQGLIAQREELEEKMHGEGVTDEDRDALFKSMRETDRQVRQYAQQERETLIDQTSRALGFSGDDATAVAETLRAVISSTESGHGAPPPPPDGPSR